MVKVFFGKRNEPGFELSESPDLIAVRTRSQRSVRGVGPVSSAVESEVVDGSLVLEFPDVGVEVYRVPVEKRSVESRKQLLRQNSDVRFAGAVLTTPNSQTPVLYTENFYIRFSENLTDEQCLRILSAAGLGVKRTLTFATNAFFVEAPEGTGQAVFEIAQNLLDRKDVVYCHPELIFPRQRRGIFPQEWHLDRTTINGNVINAHANVAAAHAVTRGEGVVIAVIDDGIDIDHPEFSGSGKIVAPRDASLRNQNPRPQFAWEKHGTPCAGVACAAGMDGASGVAPAARLMPIRYAGMRLGSIQEAEAFQWAADHGADIISCSWGPPDGRWFDPNDPRHFERFDLPASTKDAIDYAVSHGRTGKGCVIFFAAGNGNESVDLDGYASYSEVIAVSACNDTGRRSAYSDFGNAVWCAFPSSDVTDAPFPHPTPLTSGIWTTDNRGRSGYNPGQETLGDSAGNYINQFGGTSSSCPGAAGVAALVLSQNSELKYTDVRDILRRCCDRIDPGGGNYDSATGRSPYYGFGRLNAATAVELATRGRGRLMIIRKAVNEVIPDLGSVEADIEVANSVPVEDFAVHIGLRHTYVGDLVITLIPPPESNASNVVLQRRSGGNMRDLDRQFDANTVPALASFRNSNCSGTWTFRIEDKAKEDSGVLDQVSIHLTLPPAQPEPETDITASRSSTAKKTTSKRKTPTRKGATKKSKEK